MACPILPTSPYSIPQTTTASPAPKPRDIHTAGLTISSSAFQLTTQQSKATTMQANLPTGSLDLPATGLGYYAAATSRLSTYGHHSVRSLLQHRNYYPSQKDTRRHETWLAILHCHYLEAGKAEAIENVCSEPVTVHNSLAP